MSQTPRITVLLPVYNGGSFLPKAIESILNQTFTDFELLIIDDGSTDGSYDLAADFLDARIRLVRQNENLGLVAALNLGLTLARGEYIARMDADDISMPERLEKQAAFMDDNPSVGVCGCWLQTFSGTVRTLWKSPVCHDEINVRLIFESALYHATVLIRKSLLVDNNLSYANNFPFAEDYELWSRCVSKCRLANLAEVLYLYRINHKVQENFELRSKRKSADTVRLRLLQGIGMQPSFDELSIHHKLSVGQVPEPNSITFLKQSHDWLKKIQEANATTHIFPEPELTRELSARWFVICSRSTQLGPLIICSYLFSSLSRYFPGQKRDIFALAAKSILYRSGS